MQTFVERGRSHACVMYYSVGNESDWDGNILRGSKYVSKADPTRPVKFSWGYMPPEGCVEFSAHYKDLPGGVQGDGVG